MNYGHFMVKYCISGWNLVKNEEILLNVYEAV